ncbi:Putative uncharacterized protein [Taphrina deformans PYCC 5710]|uniref:Squalene/phytoene synthase n=1 Tax=Taphrina deformans (strain PYCC 5710 / ATCC 11124 / CBS 356.35 / IMI 108563 / JCM 9778 / NBRC 8474) TaxID=1097556 RepID=R4X7K5_TAPDE|nr:Putative uncharacterized protein [Taphrina deformans PYCC 5710]|eukprot:CCG81103.1 Putative uncharacterized protein [Taphrina deformans PYCC 5710]
MSALKSVESARLYCKDLLRKYDYPSFLLSTFQPQRSLDSFLALRALNVDLALIPDNVSNTTVGKMRYQFWTESVDKAFRGVPPAQPVAILLNHVLESGVQLTKPYVLRLIAERERRIDNMTFPSLSGLESYAEKTYSTLLYLHLESLDIRRPDIDDIAQHIGLAMGITSTLRGFPYFISKKIVPLPTDICTAHNLRQQDLLRTRDVDGLQDAMFEVATRANDHLISAKVKIRDLKERPEVVKDANAVFLNAVPAKLFLERLESYNFDATEPKLMKKEWKLPYRLWRGF